MSITEKDLQQIAVLARLGIEEKDYSELTSRLNTILGMADKLQEVDVSGIQPMSHPLEIVQRLRADEASATIDREKLQTTANETHEGLYLVPKVID